MAITRRHHLQDRELLQQAAEHLQDERRIRLFGPALLIALGAMATLLVTAIFLIVRFDASTATRERDMVSSGLEQRIDELAAVVVPQFSWDEAVANLSNRFDPKWADENVASYLHTLNGFNRVVVFSEADRPVYSAIDGVARQDPRDDSLVAAATAVLPQLRRLEAARSGDTKRPGSGVPPPIQAKAITWFDNRPHVLVATLVQPDFGRVRQVGKNGAVAVAAIEISPKLLDGFADRFQLEGARLVSAARIPSGMNAVPLREVDGTAHVALAWIPRKPGSELLAGLKLPLVCILLVFALLAWHILRQGSAIASELIASEARAKHLAFHDPLTQLANRSLLFERLRQVQADARRRETRFAVHCIDLDRFKEVNDTLGHNAGDELIKAVAVRLRKLCREVDTIARLGGDEFVIVQVETDPAGAAQLAERVLGALNQPYQLEYGRIEIGCSIGVALVDHADTDPLEALRWADLALYRSKDAGRMCVTFFEPEMDAALRLRRALELDLRAAINAGTLQMAYQPQVDARGEITAVEALVRWTHPERGVIPPGIFVPLAEESGLILDLGEFVLRRVFTEARAWPHIRTAINISAVQLRAPAFISLVTRIAAEERINPARIEFEVTETALLGDDPATFDNIEGLKRLGFSIALDDFGTGYSSLSVLQRFAVDKLKIDRSFVLNLGASAEALALVDAMIKLARALNLAVVAEGVETEAQRDRLAACGCTEFQGHLIGMPMGAAEIITTLASNKPPAAKDQALLATSS